MPDLMIIAAIALKTCALIGIAGLLSVALRRQPAAFHHLLWTSALALCVLMPMAVVLLPSHAVVTLPAAPLPAQASAGESGWGLSEWILSMWVLGTACVLMRELLAGIGLVRWRLHARPLASARWMATLAHTSAAQDFHHRGMRVLESQHIASPCTWGVLRPVLLLPTAGDTWPESARRSALLHELAHVQRRDALSTLISRLACAIHWYNPLVWFAAGRIRALQERACDDEVLSAGAMPSEYAQFLLNVAAHVSGLSPPVRVAIGMAHCQSLRARIVAILDPTATRVQPQRLRVAAACASLFAITVLLATAGIAVEAPPPPVPPPTTTLTQPLSPVAPTPPVPLVQPIPPTPLVLPVPPVPPTPPVDRNL